MPVTVNTFELPDATQSVQTSLRQILDFINKHLPQQTEASKIGFRAKFIVTELLTNALKHAGHTETSMRVTIDEKNITIKKMDYGKRFNPNNLASLLNRSPGFKVQLSSDVIHSIYAVVEKGCQVRFAYEENLTNAPLDISEIMEHFGMLIIIKAADEFTYQYDQSSGQNTFDVVLKLS